MDLEQTRFNMVEQQIRPWDVLDEDVLKLLFELRREEFVPAAYRSLAFVDMEIPLGHGEVMLTPKLEARILQEHVTRFPKCCGRCAWLCWAAMEMRAVRSKRRSARSPSV